jgi:hypothetical protein
VLFTIIPRVLSHVPPLCSLAGRYFTANILALGHGRSRVLWGEWPGFWPRAKISPFLPNLADANLASTQTTGARFSGSQIRGELAVDSASSFPLVFVLCPTSQSLSTGFRCRSQRRRHRWLIQSCAASHGTSSSSSILGMERYGKVCCHIISFLLFHVRWSCVSASAHSGMPSAIARRSWAGVSTQPRRHRRPSWRRNDCPAVGTLLCQGSEEANPMHVSCG